MRPQIPISLLIFTALLGCSNTTPTSTTTANTPGLYSAYTQAYQIPYVNAPTFGNLTSTLQINATVNGGSEHAFTIDTGSVGVVLPATDIPNLPANSPAGSLTYTSSGLELIGVWATLPITFPDAIVYGGAASTATATIPILAVTSTVCTGVGVNAGSCTGTIPHELGIGFGRGTTVQTSPLYNPALNVPNMLAGTMRRGYLIEREGLVLGLTNADVNPAYVSQTLTSAGAPAAGTYNDWQTPSGGFLLGAGNQLNGTVLIDTGLLDMFLEDASLPSSGQPANNTYVKIVIGTHDYVFNSGDGGDATPTSVNYATASHGTYVNTGLRALGHYNILYDADGGLFGLWYVN